MTALDEPAEDGGVVDSNQAAASAVSVSVSSSAAASDTATDGVPLAAEVVAEVALEHVYVAARARTSSTQKGKAWSMKYHQKLGCYKCTTPTTLEAAERFGRTVHLNPGDQLYVPIMWFHSVDTRGWSVTANMYHHLRTGQNGAAGDPDREWRRYIEGKKHPEWAAYEESAGLRLC